MHSVNVPSMFYTLYHEHIIEIIISQKIDFDNKSQICIPSKYLVFE